MGLIVGYREYKVDAFQFLVLFGFCSLNFYYRRGFWKTLD